jgi:hypothetical protein
VECLEANDCARSSSPVCDTRAHACVACLVDADCVPPNPICKINTSDSSANVCVACTSDADCGPEAPICDLNANECTARCANSSQCGPATPVCNEQSEICVQCLSNGDCVAPAATCNTATARCVECLDDESCSGGEVCDVTSHTCVGCLDSTQCLDAFSAHCLTEPAASGVLNTCGACVGNRDCVNKPGVGRQCRLTDGVCVECLTDDECSDDPSASTCSQLGACTACALDADCSLIPGRNACIQGRGCVECTNDTSCAGNTRGPVCKSSNTGEAAGDAPANTCVECTSDADCGDAAAAACVNNVCVACVANADCSHVRRARDGATLGICDEGRCVECTGPQRAACVASVCDNSTKECTTIPAGTAEFCDPCLSDAQCSLDGRSLCSRHLFGATDLGFFCFPVGSASAQEACALTPFSELTLTTTSDGRTAELCLLDSTTCAGMRDTTGRQQCASDADCGVPGLDDGRCLAGFCSIACSTERDCFDPVFGSCSGGACQL